MNVADFRPASSPGLSSTKLGGEAPVLGPAEVHAEQHLGPVLRVGAAGAGVDRDDGVAGVVLAVEERVLLQALELRPERLELRGDLLLEGRVELEQLARVVVLGLQALVALEALRQARVLGRDARCAGLVVPEAGLAHRRLELRHARADSVGVKGNHEPRRAGL